VTIAGAPAAAQMGPAPAPQLKRRIACGETYGEGAVHASPPSTGFRLFVILGTIVLPELVAHPAPAALQPRLLMPSDLPPDAAAPDSFLAEFATTKGAFTMKARRGWSPHGVDRLYRLVRGGYYDGLVIYRVGPTKSAPGGLVVQFGGANDPEAIRAWERDTIPDEPVVRPHRRGSVCFARGGPNSRSVELAITTNAATVLDTVNYLGVKGFPSVAEVEDSLDVLDRLESKYGNAPIESDSLSILGSAWLDRAFPGLDRIRRARITREWRVPRRDEDGR
jgi:peptidyl-prolyl cis-trans isomerase A (cyclophilin A)